MIELDEIILSEVTRVLVVWAECNLSCCYYGVGINAWKFFR
jgi:hypothetical protein